MVSNCCAKVLLGCQEENFDINKVLSRIIHSICRRSGPERSHGPKIRTGPKFGTGPKTGPLELPKVQYIFTVLKINVANFDAFVVKNLGSKLLDHR